MPPDGEWHDKASILVLLEVEEVRKSFTRDLRWKAVGIAAKQVGYPIAVKHLKIDPENSDGLIFAKEKTYSGFLLWKDTDPLIVGGYFAKEALAVTNSIISGKTEVSYESGFPLIILEDEILFINLAEGFKS